MKKFLLFTFLFLFIGCAPRVWISPELSLQTAKTKKGVILKPGSNVKIYSVDGVRATNNTFETIMGYVSDELHIPAGKHELTLAYEWSSLTGSFKSYTYPSKYTFSFRDGHEYQINAVPRDDYVNFNAEEVK